MPNKDAVPVEVIILTDTSDIKGTVYVSKFTKSNRELTELLNDKERRAYFGTLENTIIKIIKDYKRLIQFRDSQIVNPIFITSNSQVLRY